SLAALAGISGLAIALAALSRLHVRAFARDVWLFVPLFSAAIALPALFRRFTPGAALFELGPLTITRPGALAAARLVLRAGASVGSRMAVLLGKAHRTAEEVHLAMIARGFDGEWRTLAAPRPGARDAALVIAAAALAALVVLAPRAGVP